MVYHHFPSCIFSQWHTAFPDKPTRLCHKRNPHVLSVTTSCGLFSHACEDGITMSQEKRWRFMARTHGTKKTVEHRTSWDILCIWIDTTYQHILKKHVGRQWELMTTCVIYVFLSRNGGYTMIYPYFPWFILVSLGGTHQLMNRFDYQKSHRDFSGGSEGGQILVVKHGWLKIQAISIGRLPATSGFSSQSCSNTTVYPKHRLMYSWSVRLCFRSSHFRQIPPSVGPFSTPELGFKHLQFLFIR